MVSVWVDGGGGVGGDRVITATSLLGLGRGRSPPTDGDVGGWVQRGESELDAAVMTRELFIPYLFRVFPSDTIAHLTLQYIKHRSRSFIRCSFPCYVTESK